MTNYSGAFARFYDLIYADKPYAAEAAALNVLFEHQGVTSGGRLLDLACGTGRHAVELASHGWSVTAVDLSEEMLHVAAGLAADRGVEMRLLRGDMRALALDGSFDVVVSLFDSIGYAGSEEAVIATLQGVRDHLNDDGIFVFEAWHALTMVKGHDPVRVRYVDDKSGGEIVRISETSIDEEASQAIVRFTFFVPQQNGCYERYVEVHRNMFFTVPKLRELLIAAGLVDVEWRPGLLGQGEINEDTWHVVGVARKA